jgi:hypothetical protein
LPACPAILISTNEEKESRPDSMDFEIIGRISSIETIRAEIHWYEATGIGRKEFKIKRPLEAR